MRRERLFDVAGFIILSFWLFFTGVQFYLKIFPATFWFCNIIVIFLVIACFERSLPIFYFVLGMALLFETPWIIDWIFYISFDFSFLNLAGFYEGLPSYFMILTFIRHALTVPMILFLLFFIRPRRLTKKAVKISLSIIVLILLSSFFFGVQQNINCVYHSCVPALKGFLFGFYYSVLWVIFITFVSLLTALFIAYPIHTLIWKLKSRIRIDGRNRVNFV